MWGYMYGVEHVLNRPCTVIHILHSTHISVVSFVPISQDVTEYNYGQRTGASSNMFTSYKFGFRTTPYS